ncbi:hypothetical protein FW774_15245 [Pedobacter sp. BS3]|uniref:NACHT domain-containing protein n=1 Tax=Pedobacter sp. BS3 TaxID=2567937 RepID=UPI0011EE5105|nr:hypothetical protein [Pedobacter sp. BS3]TZF82048.1 hypothetical protein FW774_15245 [Pedobacter sp. BS3]
MPKLSPSHLDQLKKLVQFKAGIKIVTPADCKTIAMEISRKVHKSISETTIKRLYGFADAKHQFSVFTISVLCEFIDVESWEEFCTTETLASVSIQPGKWEAVQQRAQSITDFTLKTIQNRSGIPYNLTVSRQFAERDIDYFLKSNYSFTCFISQPGYGKTILLSHLVENLFRGNDAPHANSIILFVNANMLSNADNVTLDIESWINEQLGFSINQSFIDYFNQHPDECRGKIVLIMDGFDEILFRKDQISHLFDSLTNFICANDSNKWLKIILSMRSITWITFYDRIRHSAYLKSQWFCGNYFQLDDFSNVPPLTDKEITQIVTKIDHVELDKINPKLWSQFKYPFYIQLYYQLKEENRDFDYHANLSYYELISRFVRQKIYLSKNYTEKLILLKRIIQITDYAKKGNLIYKESILQEITMLKNAYEQLLVDGILLEEKHFESTHPREIIRFIHPNIFEYFLFIEILEKFDRRVNAQLFNYINMEYEMAQVRLHLLQWAIRYTVMNNDLKPLTGILNLHITLNEKNYIILFIAETLKSNKIKQKPEMVATIRQLHQAFINELVHFDFMDPCYKEAIYSLLSLTEHEDEAIIYHFILVIIATLECDKKQIETEFEYLSKVKPPQDSWLAYPLKALCLIYRKISDIPVSNRELTDSIKTLKEFSGLFTSRTTDNIAPEQIITYVFITLVNIFYGDKASALNIIMAIREIHPQLFYKRSSFSIYMLTLLGIACARLNQNESAEKIAKTLTAIRTNYEGYTFTNYAKAMLLILKAELNKNKENFTQSIQDALEGIKIFKENGIVLNQIILYYLLIDIYTMLGDNDKLAESRYQLQLLAEEENISLDYLISPAYRGTKKEIYTNL